MTQAVIVNADDFGLSRGVNRAIVDAHEAGVLTSTTVLVSAPRAEEAATLPERCPELGVGLHVNLTFGRPALDPARVRSLVDDDGRFVDDAELARRLARRAVDLRHVHDEVAAQADGLLRLGVKPTHWDAHRSVAFWPFLRAAAAAAAQRAGIPSVRTPRIWVVAPRTAPWRARLRWRLERPRRWLTEANRLAAHASFGRTFRRPDWLVSPNLVLGVEGYAERWAAAFASLPPGVSEVVAHPGYVDDELRAVEPGLVDARAEDLAALLAPETRALLDLQSVGRLTFRDL